MAGTDQSTEKSPATAPVVHNLIAMAHVADVDASVSFYQLLGLAPREVMRDESGRAFWASLRAGAGSIMLTRASGPIRPEDQAVLFYLYTDDVEAMRRHLLKSGQVHDGAVFAGQPGPNGGRAVAFEVTRPFYMPAGELRVHDPDGYCLLIGQQSGSR